MLYTILAIPYDTHTLHCGGAAFNISYPSARMSMTRRPMNCERAQRQTSNILSPSVIGARY
eukprot:7805378-Pyramimonas_sp.AAC.1